MPFWYPAAWNNDYPPHLPAYDVRDGKLYSTVHCGMGEQGVRAFEVHGLEVYPTRHNTRFPLGSAAYEIKGSEVFPSIHNPMYSPDLPMYKVG